MSRCDQYIGLTKKGNEFMKRLIHEPNAFHETCVVYYPAFDVTPMHGDRVIIGDRTYQEELQYEPWSSGPMYFLHIAIYNNKTGKLIGYIGSWEYDRNLEKRNIEFDYEKGTLWC